jgi:hypothetical protein
MIVFKPDNKLKKRFNQIDWQVLSCVYSLMFDSIYNVKKKRDYIIRLKLTANIDSYYAFQAGRNVRINISELVFDQKIFYVTLLHEFRHFIQDKVFKIPITKANYDETSIKSYMRSPIEIDARAYERLTLLKVVNIYNRLVTLKKSFKRLGKYRGTKI